MMKSVQLAACPYRFQAGWAVGAVLGIVLLIAGVMKARQVAATAMPTVAGAVLSPPAPLVVLAECALGLWLLSGIGREKSRLAALGCFALFAGVSLASAAAGERSCGCFGAAEINPLATAALDITAVAALVCLGRGRRETDETLRTPIAAGEAAL